MPFDLGHQTTRVLTAGAFIAAGVAAPLLGPSWQLAAIVAPPLANLGANVLATDIHGALTRRLGSASKVLHNHDLRRAVGEAIRLVLLRTSEAVPKPDRRPLRRMADGAPRLWQTYPIAPGSRLEGITEARLSSYFSEAPNEFAQVRALEDESAWRFLVDELIPRGWFSRPPSSASLATAAHNLHTTFHLALREVLKQDSATATPAYRGMMLQLHGEIGAAIRGLSEDIRGLKEQLAEVHGDLKDDLDDLKGDVAAVKKAVTRGPSPNTGAPAPNGSPILWKVPPSNPHFLDIHDVLARLHRKPKKAHRVALWGQHGVGKTQAAIAYAHKHRKDYTAIFWIGAETVDTAAADVATIARGLRLPEAGEADVGRIIDGFKAWLDDPDHAGWLLILDNANDLELAERLSPTAGQGRILITTNAPELARRADLPVELKVLAPEAAAHALLILAGRLGEGDSLDSATSEDRAAALTLGEELGGLMLAIEAAASFIADATSPAAYLGLFRADALKFLAEEGDYRDHKSVAVTFRLALERIEGDHAAAADLVRLCAVLAPDAIPEEILTADPDVLGEPLGPALADDHTRLRTIRAACRYSLLTYDPDAKALSIHRLAQVVLRHHMGADALKLWAGRSIEAVNSAFRDITFPYWSICDRLLPHALECGRTIEALNLETTEADRLLCCTASYLDLRGRYGESELLHRRSMAISERVWGSDHSETATSLNNLAYLLRARGDLGAAEPLYRRALEIREAALGPRHPDTAQSLNNLAYLLRVRGDLGAAEPLCRRALEIREAALGPRHPDTATSLNNLAHLLRARGDLGAAEPLYRRALEIREAALGPRHPDTATSLNNLAGLLEGRGDLGAAEPLCRRALEITEAALGPDHPHTRVIRGNLDILLTELAEGSGTKLS